MANHLRKSKFTFSRRRFAFWVGLGIFTVGERLNANGFDRLAAATMKLGGSTSQDDAAKEQTERDETPEHWTAAENNTWRWYERETLIDGEWKRTGRTTPVNKFTGERYTGHTGYLDDSLVPDYVIREQEGETPVYDELVDGDAPEGKPSVARKARHGRPPSKWLRSLTAEELRIWLKTINVPETGVSGMTFWTHLTRDHSFDPELIDGLDEEEQAMLHSAAHYGY